MKTMWKRVGFWCGIAGAAVLVVACGDDSSDAGAVSSADATANGHADTNLGEDGNVWLSDTSGGVDAGDGLDTSSTLEDIPIRVDSDTPVRVDAASDGATTDFDSASRQDAIEITDLNTTDATVLIDVTMVADVSDGSDVLGSPDTSGPAGPAPFGCVTSITSGHQAFWCQDRLFDVQVPTACLQTPCGLILDVHGLTMSAAMQEKNTQLRKLGDQYGYIVIQPNAQPDPPLASWIPGEDDVRIERFLSDAMVAYSVDPDRIHMTGFSQGGFMTWRFLCKHSDWFASVAPAAACTGGGADACGFVAEQSPLVRVPILYMHGTDDVLVPFECAQKQRDAIIAAWQLDQSLVTSQDENHIRTRFTNLSGDVFEFLQHDYTNDSPVLKSHCFPGSADVSPTEPGQILSYGCNPPNVFAWGQEVITFFVAHPKSSDQ